MGFRELALEAHLKYPGNAQASLTEVRRLCAQHRYHIVKEGKWVVDANGQLFVTDWIVNEAPTTSVEVTFVEKERAESRPGRFPRTTAQGGQHVREETEGSGDRPQDREVPVVQEAAWDERDDS